MFPSDPTLHRLSVDDVYRMVEVGVLREDDRVELIDGVLVDMMPPGPNHSGCVEWLTQHFAGSVGERAVRVQDLLLVEGGFVMPDLMVIDRQPRDRHPSTAALVGEVSVTSYSHDAWKSRRYAGAGVGEYWIVDLPRREVVVQRVPLPDGYREVARHADGDRVPTPVGAPEVEVTALLGPR